MNTFSTVHTLFAAVIGYLVYLALSWGEWQKLAGTKMSLWQFVREDQAGFTLSAALAVFSYLALPELAQIEWFRSELGFTPARTPMSAGVFAFGFAELGYQLRAICDRIFGKLK